MFTSYGLSPLWTGEAAQASPIFGINGNTAAQDAQLAYESPTFFGVTLNGAVFFDRNDDSATGGQENHDYGLGAAWSGMGINAGVQWLQVNDDVGAPTFLGACGTSFNGTCETQATRVHAGYSAARWGVAGSYELIDLQGAGGAELPNEEYTFVSGWFGVTQGTRIAASVGMTNETLDPSSGASAEGTGVQVGVFHDVIDNFTVHAGGSWYDLKDNDQSGPDNADDTYIVALGASYKFELGFMAR